MDEDHRLLLRCSLALLKSRNSGVVLGVSALHFYCGNPDESVQRQLGKALVRLLRSCHQVQYVVLASILPIAKEYPFAFKDNLKDFFVKATDAAYVRQSKLNIMVLLLDEQNRDTVLKEFTQYVKVKERERADGSVPPDDKTFFPPSSSLPLSLSLWCDS